MILRRLTENLRTQNWTAITIEFVIVVIGVCIGIQVSNWNDERVEETETIQVLRGLKPELTNLVEGLQTLQDYYVVTRRYADTAYAGWRGETEISDREFVIAAYQASQNTFTGTNNGTWSAIFGSDRLRTLEDQDLRTDLALLMSQDYTVIEKEIFTDYRKHVRQVIPEDIQDAIRAHCGDQRFGAAGFIKLPTNCTLNLPEERFRIAARELREHSELVGEMRWHFAAVASYVGNIDNLGQIARRVLKRIDSI